jgi:excisionase family DNA binding protein
VQLGISFPTIKPWIYQKKIRSNQTAGGHRPIPQSEVDRLLFRTRGKTEPQRKEQVRRVSVATSVWGKCSPFRSVVGWLKRGFHLVINRSSRS